MSLPYVVNHPENVTEFTRGEKIAQQHMDVLYASRGYRIDRTVACINYDLFLDKPGASMTVEEKFIRGDFGEILIELVQAAEFGQLGWFYHCQAAYLHYVVTDPLWHPLWFYRVNWQPFKRWFLMTLQHTPFPRTVTSVKGRGIAVNIGIYRRSLPSEFVEIVGVEA